MSSSGLIFSMSYQDILVDKKQREIMSILLKTSRLIIIVIIYLGVIYRLQIILGVLETYNIVEHCI